jgi:hypothetical protein
MATPSRNDRMVRNIMQQNAAKGKGPSSCGKQFPECPEEPNDNDCKTCPFYKKKK